MRSIKAVAALVLALSATTSMAEVALRPEPPQRPALQAVAEDCEVPERRDRLIADPEAFIEAAAAYGLELNRHSERLMEWRNRQFLESGRWTRDDEARFGLALLQNPAFMEEAAASMNMAMDVLAPLTRFAEDGRAPAEKCRDLLETQAIFDRLTSSVERQWRMIDEAYATEATRLGMSLD